MEAAQQLVNDPAQQTYICASNEVFEKAVAPFTDEDGTSQSTEPGDLSAADVSEHGEENSRISDASDSEAVPNESISAGSSPQRGFIAPPPGLDLPSQLTVETRSRLSSNAPLFVPSFSGLAVSMSAPVHHSGPWNSPVETQDCTPPDQKKSKQRQTISLWEATEPEVSSPLQVESEEAEALIALQEAVSQLTPGATAMLRSFLDSKDFGQANLAMQHNQFTAVPAEAAAPPSTTAPTDRFQSRPYTPFGCKPSAKGAGGTRSKSRSKPATTAAPEDTAQPTVDDSKETLRTNLRTLKALGRERVLGVRKMNRLGFNSPELLEAYFSKFGSVDRVMVSHSHAKSMFGRRVRVRPAGLGFVVMSSAEEVQAILEAGSEHEIKGCTVSVYPFESGVPLENEDAEDCAHEDR